MAEAARLFAEDMRHLPDLPARDEHEHLVIGLNGGVAPRHDGPHAARDPHHAEGEMGAVLSEICQPHPHDRSVAIDPDAHQLDASFSELHHVRRRRATQQRDDLVRRGLLGVDDVVDAEVLQREDGVPAGELARAHARDRNRVRRRLTDPLRHHRGDDVDLVHVRDGHEQVGLLDPRQMEGLHARARSLHREHVERLADVGDPRRVPVDDGDVVTLEGKHPGDVVADVSGADDNGTHG